MDGLKPDIITCSSDIIACANSGSGGMENAADYSYASDSGWRDVLPRCSTTMVVFGCDGHEGIVAPEHPNQLRFTIESVLGRFSIDVDDGDDSDDDADENSEPDAVQCVYYSEQPCTPRRVTCHIAHGTFSPEKLSLGLGDGNDGQCQGARGVVARHLTLKGYLPRGTRGAVARHPGIGHRRLFSDWW